jgi:hypothetical protein
VRVRRIQRRRRAVLQELRIEAGGGMTRSGIANRAWRLLALVGVPILLFAASASAQVAMPDPTQIAGMAIPAPELPNGTVSVRLVREQLGNNIVGHEVTVKAGAVTKTVTTDEAGRATFTGLPAGGQATAETNVDGEQVVSKPFAVPESGGIRVILISGIQGALERRKKEQAEAAAAPPTKGIVVFGGDTRIIFEFQDDSLRAFYLLDIVNTARTRVDVGGPLIIDLPPGAAGASVLEGSFPGATARGDRVTIAGPFPAGTSSVQIGFTLPYSGAELTVAQKFPAAVERTNVIVEKVGAIQLTSPQFASHREANADDGTPFIVGNGGSVAAGQPLTLQFTGLPTHSTWPRDIALALAALIVFVGVWLAFRGRATADEQRRRLHARRDALYGELVKLEEQYRVGRVDSSRYHSKRHHLVTELERVYGELDGGGEAAA